MSCNRCGSEAVITDEHDQHWCRPCAQVEGMRLLKAEHLEWFKPGGRFNR